MAIDWGAVKKEFEQDGITIERLAEKNGCKATTVARRAVKEGWKAAAHGEKSVESPGQSPPAQEAAGTTPVLDYGSLWKGVRRRLVSGLHNNDAKLGLEELKVAKLAGEVLSNVIKGERMAFGDTDEEDDPQGIAREMARLTLPPGAGEADEGE